MGDFHNEMTLTTGGTSTPAEFIRASYGYKHDYLGKCLSLESSELRLMPLAWQGLVLTAMLRSQTSKGSRCFHCFKGQVFEARRL